MSCNATIRKFRVDAMMEDGLDTGLSLQTGQLIRIVAHGEVSIDGGTTWMDPDGIEVRGPHIGERSSEPNTYFDGPNGKGIIGALIGWIGANRNTSSFFIGKTQTKLAETPGRLYLSVNDSIGMYWDNHDKDGEPTHFTVRVEVYPPHYSKDLTMSEYKYDAFINYSSTDKEWVKRELLPRMDRAGIRYIEQRQFKPGRSRLDEIERAVRASRWRLLILSPSYLADTWQQFGNILAISYGLDIGEWRVIPIFKESCELPSRLSLLIPVDLRTGDEAEWERLITELVPQPRSVEHQESSSPVFARQPFEPGLVFIPAGKFLMGSDPHKDTEAKNWEQPQHLLHLPDYHMAKTPITNDQYLAFVQSTGHRRPQHWADRKIPKGKEDHPVVYISWHDAMAYCRWLAKVTDKSYRLPSEAEWEKAARGTDGRIYPWGNQLDAERYNALKGDEPQTTPVGTYSKGASPYGLLDMVGNVWQWTISLWGPGGKVLNAPKFRYPYDSDDGREDSEAEDDVRRVVRGGFFAQIPFLARCSFRHAEFPDKAHADYGFRVVIPSIVSEEMRDLFRFG